MMILMKRLTWSSALALFAIAMWAPSAGADVASCERAIVKAGARFLQSKTESLNRCDGSVVKSGSGSCPDARASAAISKAQSKMESSIAKRCGGSDRICNADLIDEILPPALSWPFICPNVGHELCNNPITSCASIATCIACISGEVANESLALSYDHLVLPSTGDSTLNKCQRSIGNATSAFLSAQSKAYQRCWDDKIEGKHANSCVPPAVGDGRYLDRISKAKTKQIRAITRACGGPDRTLGGGDDLTPAQIGFPADCPAVTVPGGASCGGPITDLNGVITCSNCLAELEASCADRLQVPQETPYPPECTACLAPTPTGLCPTSIEFTADGPNVDLDTGWSGLGHNAKVPTNGKLTLQVTSGSCAGTNQPTCGQCAVTGPLPNAGGAENNNHRCQVAPWVQCTVDGECPAGPCIYYFGAPLPLVAGGVSTCVVNEVSGALGGTINLDDGTSALTVPLASKVHPTGTVDAPCPNCVSDLRDVNDHPVPGCENGLCCDAGPRTGKPCITMGTGIFGDVTLDCPPDPGSNAGTLDIALNVGTGTQTVTLTSASPPCNATGYVAICVGGTNASASCSNESECPGGQCGRRCFCDTCNNGAAQSCSSNADCPDPAGPVGPICGGKRCRGGPNNGTPCAVVSECPGGGKCGRPGEPTQPNACLDDTSTLVDGKACVSLGGNEGECPEGPVSQRCSIENFRTCTDNLSCTPVSAGGTCIPCKVSGQSCNTQARPCFTDSGILGASVAVTGTAEVPCGDSARPAVGTFFCVAPVSADAVNGAAGLPSLGRALIPGRVTTLP